MAISYLVCIRFLSGAPVRNSDTLNNKVKSTYMTIGIDNEAQCMSSPFITEGSEVVKKVKK